MSEQQPMKIVKFKAENIKRILAVEIVPGDSNMIEISGKNGVGKTSILDALWWVIAGPKAFQEKPVRDGAEKGMISVDLERFTVTRTFDAGGGSKLLVETKDGFSPKKPQNMLDSLLSDLTFDPLAFQRASDKEQAQILKGFVEGFDFEATEKALKDDFDERTLVRRQLKEAKARVDTEAPEVPDGIDTAALRSEIEALDTSARNYVAAKSELESAKSRDADLALKVEGAEAELESMRKAWAEQSEHARLMKEQFDSHSEPESTDALVAKLQSAEDANAEVARAEERLKGHNDAVALVEKYTDEDASYTEAIETYRESIVAAVASADLPVEGMSLQDGIVTYSGQPFSQASDAEQLKVSLALAMAANPLLRVIRIRDGSLLDDDTFEVFRTMAEENDYQIWIETVGEGHEGAIVIEDGMVRDVKE